MGVVKSGHPKALIRLRHRRTLSPPASLVVGFASIDRIRTRWVHLSSNPTDSEDAPLWWSRHTTLRSGLEWPGYAVSILPAATSSTRYADAPYPMSARPGRSIPGLSKRALQTPSAFRAIPSWRRRRCSSARARNRLRSRIDRHLDENSTGEQSKWT